VQLDAAKTSEIRVLWQIGGKFGFQSSGLNASKLDVLPAAVKVEQCDLYSSCSLSEQLRDLDVGA
jgi:hypothetical protein